MTVELPGSVADLLRFFGIDWPTINEDAVRELAAHVRRFAQNMDSVHQDATATVHAMGQAYQGASYDALVEMWTNKSSKHLYELTEACGVVARALDAGAEVIVGMKWSAIAELSALAASFVAEQAAAAAAFGRAEEALAAIGESTRKIIDDLVQRIIGYLSAEVVNAALQPLLGKVKAAVEGRAFREMPSAAGGGGVSVGSSFMVAHDELVAYSEVMRGHAETAAAHARTFRSAVAGVSFAS